MQTGLYIVGTPIGNLSDMSPRAVQVLQSVDLIAAEDTRVFGKLAAHFDIKTKRISCHEHNERDVVPVRCYLRAYGAADSAASDDYNIHIKNSFSLGGFDMTDTCPTAVIYYK